MEHVLSGPWCVSGNDVEGLAFSRECYILESRCLEWLNTSAGTTDDSEIDHVIQELNGKDIESIITAGKARFSAGGGSAAVQATGGATKSNVVTETSSSKEEKPKAKEEPKEEPKEEEDEDMGFGLFD